MLTLPEYDDNRDNESSPDFEQLFEAWDRNNDDSILDVAAMLARASIPFRGLS